MARRAERTMPRTCRAGWKSKKSCDGGFTLIELMVVVVVMAVMAGAIAPSLVSALSRAGIEAATKQTLELLEFAHAASVARGEALTVNFDSDRRLIWVEVRPPAFPWLEDVQPPERRTLVAVEVDKDVEVSVSHEDGESIAAEELRESLWFRPNGDMEDAFIELTDDRDRRKAIEIESATGRIALAEVD
jgi:prepilin-type N-terminal cleavage/methylation domain-containing protein